ncbi:TetR family transcriptional regulator [Streptomyces sp. NPDC047072]|uniref:TetR/AcrR family transcriptional regulator n=1 Tax=Streptomyces sp. NPDC047072 TaxID=3154809 RepID=UPI0033C20A9C
MSTPLTTRSADARIPGQRALQTRQKLVEATVGLLETGSYRNVTVKQIAHEVNTSPATFYQYFAQVEDAVLEASAPLLDATTAALAEFQDGTWSSDGPDGAARLVNAVLDTWKNHRPVLRVLTAVAAEQDSRFVLAYADVTRPVTRALTAAIGTDTPSGPLHKALVRSLVAALAAAAGQEGARKIHGLSKKTRREGLAHLVHATVTSTAAD